MTKKSPEQAGRDEREAAHVFDQTNGLLGDAEPDPRPDRTTRSGDVPVAMNMLFGGQ